MTTPRSTGKTYYLGSYRYWYDRGQKAWWAARYDAAGNQLGAAADAYTRREIVQWILADSQDRAREEGK